MLPALFCCSGGRGRGKRRGDPLRTKFVEIAVYFILDRNYVARFRPSRARFPEKYLWKNLWTMWKTLHFQGLLKISSPVFPGICQSFHMSKDAGGQPGRCAPAAGFRGGQLSAGSGRQIRFRAKTAGSRGFLWQVSPLTGGEKRGIMHGKCPERHRFVQAGQIPRPEEGSGGHNGVFPYLWG